MRNVSPPVAPAQGAAAQSSERRELQVSSLSNAAMLVRPITSLRSARQPLPIRPPRTDVDDVLGRRGAHVGGRVGARHPQSARSHRSGEGIASARPMRNMSTVMRLQQAVIGQRSSFTAQTREAQAAKLRQDRRTLRDWTWARKGLAHVPAAAQRLDRARKGLTHVPAAARAGPHGWQGQILYFFRRTASGLPDDGSRKE